ncbi:universal stress protein UspA [Haloprofundus marisrubri]|uniref:Universal stress protein UspA n=1 Tax=Haloprofundus marisrubri TaxID=1514971 RepID=A0A0W1R9U9_9EURY|nr:universal stress protein [Haloprofundus marisrubri]KTG09477.1 universal stress protein UspA [Haloprofundus marisrubri]
MPDSNSAADTSLFARPVVPVAGDDDAEKTARVALPRIAAVGGEMLALHVVEKAGGAPDKASVEQREEHASEAFAVIEELAAEAGVDVRTRVAYGTNVAATILDVAREEDASAIVFSPRGGSKWAKLLTGDVSDSLVEDADRPVVVLPTSN